MPAYSRYISKDFLIEGSVLRLDDAKKAWDALDGRMRTAVRKAQKSNVAIQRQAGTQQQLAAFRTICLNPDDIPRNWSDRYQLFAAMQNDTLIAGIIWVDIGKKLFMLCHASTPAAKKLNIPSLLIWHVAEQCAGKQWTHLDVGASYRSSLQNFFTGWRSHAYPILMSPPELKPDIRLTPFHTAALTGLGDVHDSAQAHTHTALSKKWPNRPLTFFPRAMYGIFALIRHLKEHDVHRRTDVYVTTTTDTHYVSSCVTSAIEQSATVKRKMTDNTFAIFAIHEFGFPHPRLAELRRMADERNIPLIEDCAYGWNTHGIGTVGDFAIYSLTKAFPIQFGGYVVGHSFSHQELWTKYGCSDEGKQRWTECALARWIDAQESNTAKRRSNYAYFESIFGDSQTFFPLPKEAEPGAYLLRCRDEESMNTTSAFVRGFGIECGNYWKNSAIILPAHQELSTAHLEYIAGSVLATQREWCGVPSHP